MNIGGELLSHKIIGISHLNYLDEAKETAEAINNRYRPEEDIIVSEIGATIGIYGGEGGSLIGF